MKIEQIVSRHRRDLVLDLICEHCEHEEKRVSGYDDTYFHTKVLKEMKCKVCGKPSPSKTVPMKPKYPDHLQL